MNKEEKIFISVLVILYFIPILRILFDLFIGNYMIVTIVSYPLCLVLIIILNSKYYNKMRVWSLLFLIYLLFDGFIQLFADKTYLIQLSSSLVRLFGFILSINYAINTSPSELCAKAIMRYSFVFLLYTVLADIIQYFPFLPFHNIRTFIYKYHELMKSYE